MNMEGEKTKGFFKTLTHCVQPSASEMALRRALISSRTVSFVIRTSFHSRDLSYLAPSSSSWTSTHNIFQSPGVNFVRECRRGFAKGRKQKDDGEDNLAETVNIGPSVKATSISLMEAAIDSLSRELSKLRTGRASAGMIDHIIVETGGVKMPLGRIAVVSVVDPKTLSVTPYDPNALKAMESAIVSSPLGLNPKVDGQRLIASIPPLTKEHMQALCKVVAKSSEDVKQSIRRARQKALDTIKKAGSNFPKDEAKRLEKEIDELTKKFTKSAEDMCKAKEKEISEG